MDRGRFYTSLMMLVLICQGQGQDGHLPTVGCILKSELCIAGEICINDGLFGNCQSNGSPVDHYEYDLSFGQLQDLELVVTSLVRQGHRWSEAYTQCILGTILDAFRLGITIGTDSIMDSCDLLLPRAAAVSPSADHDGQYTSDQQVAQDVDRQLQRQKDKALQDAFDDVIKQYQAQAYADEIGKVGGTDSSSEISAGDLGDVDKRVASSSDQIADAVAGDDQLSSLSNLRSDRTSSAANDGEENGVAAAKTEQEEDPTLSRHKYTKSHKRAEEAGQEEEEEIMPSNADILNLEPRYSDAQGGFPSYLTKSAKSIPEDDDDFSDKLSSFDLPMTSPNGPQGERTVGVADTEKGGAEGETYRNILSGISEQDLRDIVRYLNILEREEEDRQITAASEAAVKLMTSGQASSPVQGQDGNKADIPARSEDNDKPTNGDINGVQAIIDNMPSEDAVLLNDLIMGRITPSLLPRETVDKMVAYVNRILSDPPGGVTDSQGGVVAVPDLQNGVGAGDDLTSDGVRGSTDGGDDDDGGAAAGGDVAEGAGGGAGGGAGVGGAMSDEPVIGENPVDPPLDLPSKKDSIDKRLMGEGEGGVEFKNEYAIAESPKAKTKVKVVALNRAEKKDGDQQAVAKPITSDENNLDLLNSNSVFISVNPQLKSMEEAYSITDTLAGILDLSPHVFYDIKFNEKGVSFGVEKNFLNINATMVATLAGNHSDLIKSSTNFTVTMAGIGDNKVHVTVLNTSRPDLIMAILTLCACVACVLLCALLVFAIKKRSSAKRVDRDLSPEEASGSAKGKQHPQSTNKEAKNATNDYQDLCRQHMQNKLSEKPEPLQNVARGTSVSTCDANSPSSRSSTSSWSEEPVASNMDISTGHIILAYMEDHLKNKDRLTEEWQNLSTYEAEPNDTKVASEPANVRKNRYGDVLPYDHSRVILDVTNNISACDYINANNITDHDPRSPAYVATQGPLAHTVADFWQLVWEQGSVVIVNLTTLSENGTAMCHRYWPEEGSDLYHIYEVHLVSEHIWCDDYLVRSFYLKNLQTNETRTVTQFNFITWPHLSVPSSVKSILDFRRKVNKSYRGRSCPIVVHDSDGVGRTGTYCLLDMVLNRMNKGAKEIDIAATLEHIRDQRCGMVKTKEQFEFTLSAVAEEVHAILKALPQ